MLLCFVFSIIKNPQFCGQIKTLKVTLLFCVININFRLGLDVTDNPQVKTKYGYIQGKVVTTHFGEDTQVEEFLGIPYALPPVGQRRFNYPQPPGQLPDGKLSFVVLI